MSKSLKNIYVLTQNQCKEALEVALKADTPTILTGSPGIGKSAIISSIAEKYKLKLIDVRVSQLMPSDLLGFPKEVNGKMTYVPMDVLPLDSDPIPQGYNGFLLLLDEFNSGDKYTQAASYRLLLDRAIGNYKLHPNCLILLAGNRAIDMAVVNKLVSPIKSRITHLEMVLDLKEFKEYVLDQTVQGNWNSLVMGFINFKPDQINNFDVKTIGDVTTYACPRSYEMLSKQLNAGLLNLNPEIYKNVITGIIGEDAGNDFNTYVDVAKSLPTIQQIEADPINCPMPTDVGAQWALSALLFEGINNTNAKQVATYIERIHAGDVKVVIYRTILPKFPQIAQIPEVAKSLGLMKMKLNQIKAKP